MPAKWTCSVAIKECGSPAHSPHSSSSFQRFSFKHFSFYLTPTLSFIDNKAAAALEN